MVPRGRTQARRISETNNDAKTSFEKSCKELPRIGDGLRTARNPAGTHCSFGVRSWKEMKNRRNGFYGEVRLVEVPGWTGPNRLCIPKCSTPNELKRGIDAALFFSGEEPHYFSYPEGHFHPSELENAKETETVKSFLGRMVKKYSKDDRELTIRTPISPPISAPASASSTTEESEDNANPHRNPTIAESSQSLQAPQPPIASAQKTADKDIPTNVTDDDVTQYIRRSEDQSPSRDGVQSYHIPVFDMNSNSTAMPGAQNHSPGGIMSWYEVFDIPPWDPNPKPLESDLEAGDPNPIPLESDLEAGYPNPIPLESDLEAYGWLQPTHMGLGTLYLLPLDGEGVVGFQREMQFWMF